MLLAKEAEIKVKIKKEKAEVNLRELDKLKRGRAISLDESDEEL
jgi:hypothetical protein